MTYREERCSANCAFCPQARESSSSSDRLSRISWPEYSIAEVLTGLKRVDAFQRLCIQSLNYPSVSEDVEDIVNQIRMVSELPISVSIHPLNLVQMKRLREAGVNSIGVAVDACTPHLFDSIKGMSRGSAYRWEKHMEALENALQVFGQGNVTTHLIIGLGETELEAAKFILSMHKMGISVGLFAFTSVRGTALEKHPSPSISRYRRMQAFKHLLSGGYIDENHIRSNPLGELRMDVDPLLLREVLSSGQAFQTTGCKGCNRPFYNESPRGPWYNYPRPLTSEEVAEAIALTGLVT